MKVPPVSFLHWILKQIGMRRQNLYDKTCQRSNITNVNRNMSNINLKICYAIIVFSVNVECSPSLTPSVRVYKSASLIPFSIQGSRPMSHFRNIMTQPQRKKRNGTAAILGYSGYDGSSEYNDNDTYNERDGLGSI